MAHKWSFLLLVLFLTSDLVLASKTQFILAGDIGGTNARLRITKVTSKQRIVLKEHVYLVKDYPDFNQLITQFVREQIGDQGLSAICLAVAGPIVNQKVQFTNSSWQIAAQTLADLFQLASVKVQLINDFVGVGHGLDRLPDAKLLVLQEGNKVKQGVRAFIGAGTGLGVGYAFFNGKTYMVHPCEGGHTSFAPNTELQLNLRRYLVKKYPTTADISVEYLLSGQGIRDIYEYLVNTEQWSENAFLKKQLSLASVEQKARLIVQSALENRSDLLSREVLRCFIQILAAKTADLIFSYFPEEGMYLVGNIIPPILKEKEYQEIFKEYLFKKDKVAYLLARFPIYLVDHQMLGLDGAEKAASILAKE